MNRVHRAVATALVAAALTHTTALADPQANERQAVSSTEALTEVVVTGSRIKRDPVTAPTPLIQISNKDITESGMGSVIDVLADVPALSGSLVQEDTTGSVLNTGGLSLLNLRDLGTGRTLTLVDGRRHVGSAAGTLSVDVDTIPRLLVDRVEIITGASSALYGADAVSGAVNFVMRRNFEGIKVDAGSSQINKDGQIGRAHV